MSDTVIVALIGFLGSIIVACISLAGIKSQGKKHQQENADRFDTFQMNVRTDIVEMNTDLKHLTNEVRKHNNFAERIPVIEKELENAKEDIKKIKERLNEV